MADKKPEVKKSSKGGMSFELEILLFIIIVFVIWVIMGGSKKPVEEKPFIVPFNDPANPGMKYGAEDVNN